MELNGCRVAMELLYYKMYVVNIFKVTALFITFLTSAIVASVDLSTYYSAVHDARSVWSVVEGRGLGSASALYEASRMTTGWDTITVESTPKISDLEQAFAMGFLEAALTAPRIVDTFRNMFNNLTVHIPSTTRAAQFVADQDTWMRSQVKSESATSAYWSHVGLVLSSFDGLVDGYAYAQSLDASLPPMPYEQLRYFQLVDELDDIDTAVSVGPIASEFGEIIEDEAALAFERQPMIGAHCSAMFKSTPISVIGSHVTWSGYSSLLRLYKHWNSNFMLATASNGISFSGYSGLIASNDDFYMTRFKICQKLIKTETTNSVFNASLYRLYTTVQTVPYWVRVTVATRMATSSADWMHWFALFNSGTYCNQWMVLDSVLSTPGTATQPAGTFVVGEQIPGMFHFEDQSSYLAAGSAWVSYNIPFYPEIYNLSGYPALFQQYGNSYSWSACARAQIFARDQHTVVDQASLRQLMRYNRYQTDALSLHDPCRGISARCDLGVPWDQNVVPYLNLWSAMGGTDCKILGDDIARSRGARSCDAISGPTSDNQPPFAWTNTWASSVPHNGQPHVFDFDWVVMQPNGNQSDFTY